MILCIGLIIAVYTITRLGLEGYHELKPICPRNEAIIKLLAAGIIGIQALWMTGLALWLEFRMASL